MSHYLTLHVPSKASKAAFLAEDGDAKSGKGMLPSTVKFKGDRMDKEFSAGELTGRENTLKPFYQATPSRLLNLTKRAIERFNFKFLKLNILKRILIQMMMTGVGAFGSVGS